MSNICGQTYDNAVVMKGEDKGLQEPLQNINKYAEYVLCTDHFLCLIGETAASTVPDVLDYFGIL
jgi:hypothetical protein